IGLQPIYSDPLRHWKGFVLDNSNKHPESIVNGEASCVPRNKSNCKNGYTNGFLKYTNIKLPDTSSSWFNKTIKLDDCQKFIRKFNVRGGGSGCLLWFNNLVDLRKYSQWGQDLYIKVPASELVRVLTNHALHLSDHFTVGHRNIKKEIVGITVGVTTFGLIIICVCILKIKKPGKYIDIEIRHKDKCMLCVNVFILLFSNQSGAARKFYKHYKNKHRTEDIDFPTFNLSVLANATENFSTKNKNGEGGFGPVYKKTICQGTLIDGKVLAVKRLSKKSGQGSDEFKNEVALIAKLQHHNLVKLLGCCIEGEEKMLIYEYMPNKSLDYFVFVSKIMETITAILNPCVISDFGLARSFLGEQVEAYTNRVAGTYGYMPPEYAARGHFSVKSDVGLLFVQQRPEDRPDMSSVLLMLNGDKLLPKPKVPGFYTEKDVTFEANHNLCSAKELSLTRYYFTNQVIGIYDFLQSGNRRYNFQSDSFVHQDFRLRIIHKHLKTSNILLDSRHNLDPMISDFGLAGPFFLEIEMRQTQIGWQEHNKHYVTYLLTMLRLGISQ
ncbi:Receptor-like serine/threonine-protein kinase SD1-8, partial [Mucuna pruriens]